jgi:hypothetical protein
VGVANTVLIASPQKMHACTQLFFQVFAIKAWVAVLLCMRD